LFLGIDEIAGVAFAGVLVNVRPETILLVIGPTTRVSVSIRVEVFAITRFLGMFKGTFEPFSC
jgi:hypothetical protein